MRFATFSQDSAYQGCRTSSREMQGDCSRCLLARLGLSMARCLFLRADSSSSSATDHDLLVDNHREVGAMREQ